MHWIDNDFVYHQEFLAFEPLHDHHTGENMASIVLEVLGHYNIAHKFFAMTTDGAANNNTLAARLEDKLAAIGIDWDHEVTVHQLHILIVDLSHPLLRSRCQSGGARIH